MHPRRQLAGCRVLRYGELTIDTASRVVTYGPMPVELRRREYALLAHMARHPERLWTRHELLRNLWLPLRRHHAHRGQPCVATARQVGSRRGRRVDGVGVGRCLPARARKVEALMPPARKRKPRSRGPAALGRAVEQVIAERRGISQEFVAKKASLDVRQGNTIICGQANPTYLTLLRLGDGLRIPPSELCDRSRRFDPADWLTTGARNGTEPSHRRPARR